MLAKQQPIKDLVLRGERSTCQGRGVWADEGTDNGLPPSLLHVPAPAPCNHKATSGTYHAQNWDKEQANERRVQKRWPQWWQQQCAWSTDATLNTHPAAGGWAQSAWGTGTSLLQELPLPRAWEICRQQVPFSGFALRGLSSVQDQSLIIHLHSSEIQQMNLLLTVCDADTIWGITLLLSCLS